MYMYCRLSQIIVTVLHLPLLPFCYHLLCLVGRILTFERVQLVHVHVHSVIYTYCFFVSFLYLFFLSLFVFLISTASVLYTYFTMTYRVPSTSLGEGEEPETHSWCRISGF